MIAEPRDDFSNGHAAVLGDLVAYQADAVVSRTLVKQTGGSITLFAFDKGQELSEHTAPFDALVQVLDGSVVISIDGNGQTVSTGQCLLMPAHRPHALRALTRFKMLLTMVRADKA